MTTLAQLNQARGGLYDRGYIPPYERRGVILAFRDNLTLIIQSDRGIKINSPIRYPWPPQGLRFKESKSNL